jgi:hypothetical protein
MDKGAEHIHNLANRVLCRTREKDIHRHSFFTAAIHWPEDSALDPRRPSPPVRSLTQYSRSDELKTRSDLNVRIMGLASIFLTFEAVN